MGDRLEPQISVGERSPLSALISSAIRQFGNSHPEAVDADTVLMFLGFANQIIQDVNQHPYRTGLDPLLFYKDVRESRDVSDLIMVSGLLSYYAQQQHSERVQTATPQYFRNLNAILWQELNGNTKIEVRPLDVSRNRSRINGLREETDS